MLSTTACTAAVTRAAFVTRRSKRSVSFRSSGTMLTLTTPSIFLEPVTTCDAQELHISADISRETSSTRTVPRPARTATPRPFTISQTRPTTRPTQRSSSARTLARVTTQGRPSSFVAVATR